jgi:hypothetical protein
MLISWAEAQKAAGVVKSFAFSGAILASAATYGQVSKLFDSGHFVGSLE